MKGWYLAHVLCVVFLASEVCAAEKAGAVDLSFDAGPLWMDPLYTGGAYGEVIGVALGPNDLIHIGGHFSNFLLPLPGKRWNGIARLKPDGTLDETFAVPIYDPFTNDHLDAHAIVVDGKGTVWAGFLGIELWWCFRTDGSPNVRPARYQSTGVVAVYPDGRFLAWDSGTLRRFRPNWEADSSFQTSSFFPRLLLRDERVLVANGTNSLRRLNADGSSDPSYHTVFFPMIFPMDRLAQPFVLIEAPNGQVYVAGDFQEVNGTAFPRLARLNEDGTLDESFRPDARLTAARTTFTNFSPTPAATGIIAMAVQADGKLIAAGDFSSAPAPIKAGIVRLNLDGTLDETFDPGAGIAEANSPGYPPKIWNVVVQRDGKIVVAGDFKEFNDVARDGLVRLHGDPVEPLRIARFSVSGTRGTVAISGRTDRVEIEASSSVTGPWEPVGSASMTNSILKEVELEISGSGQRFFRLRGH